MLKCYDLIDGKVLPSDDGQRGLIQVYSAPNEEEKHYLIGPCGIDEHTLNSALDEDEISRLEYESNHVAVIIKRPRNFQNDTQLNFRISSLGAFLFKDRIIIVLVEAMPLFEHGKMPLRGNTIQGVLLRLLHHATHHFLQHLRIIRNLSDEIENRIESSMTNKSLANMFSLLKSLTYYESATKANMVLMLKIKRDAGKIGFNDEELDFLDDIMVENQQCDNQAAIYANILAGMSNARVSIISNNLAIIMKYLAIINLVFMPLNVITGLGGMSEFTMMTNKIWWPHAFSALLLGMLLISYITYVVVKQIGVTPNSAKRRPNVR